MSVNFLLFRGSKENEGNFCLLETEKSIVILAAGKDFSSRKPKKDKHEKQEIGKNYLQERKNKIKAIIVNNTSIRNVNLLEELHYDLGSSVPIYSSHQSWLVIKKEIPSLTRKVNIVRKNGSLKLDDLEISFFPLRSFLIGNLAIKISYPHKKKNIFFLEGFVSSYLLEEEKSFLKESCDISDLQEFLKKGEEKEENYLITSLQGLNWWNNNSVFFAENNLPNRDNKIFFIIYDHDWFHIIELLQIVRSWGKKLKIIDKRFLELVKETLIKNDILSMISEAPNDDCNIFLLVINKSKNLKEEAEKNLKEIEKKENLSDANFIVCTPAVIGEESKLARLLDYLHSKSEKIIDFSRKDYFALGTNFYDFCLLLQLVKPNNVIVLQNSYKYSKFFRHLPKNFIFLENCQFVDLEDRKISWLKIKESLINLDELVIKQKKNLGELGTILVILMTYWEKEELKLKRVKFDQIAIGPNLNKEKLESKIKSWWSTKITRDLKKTEKSKTLKRIIERRISEKLENYLLQEYDINLKDPLVLIFNRDSSGEKILDDI